MQTPGKDRKVAETMCNAGAVRVDEQVEMSEGHEYRSWNEIDGEFVMHVVERSGDGLYGPEESMQSVEVTKPPAKTLLFCVSSYLPPVISDANKRGLSAREHGIEFMASNHGKY